MISHEILQLTDRQMERLLRETDLTDLCICLRGLKKAVREKIYKNMSALAAALAVKTLLSMKEIPPEIIAHHCITFIEHARTIKAG